MRTPHRARAFGAHGSEARSKEATITLDTDVGGRRDAFNPAELFPATIAACMIKGIERVMPTLKFELRGVEVKLRGVRQDSPPKMISVDYELIVDTDENDRRLELLHTNVRKYGTISKRIAGPAGLIVPALLLRQPMTHRPDASQERTVSSAFRIAMSMSI